MIQSNTYNKENNFSTYLSKTFLTVALGVAISAIVAFLSSIIIPVLFYYNPSLMSIISILIVLSELGVAFYFSLRLMKMSKRTAWICYFAYSILTGFSFSTIIMGYTGATLTLTFVSTAIMFVCMALIGHSSKINYSKVYSLLLPALIAGTIATLLNILFIHSPAIDMLIVYLGLILFLLITSGDVQKLRGLYYSGQTDYELSEKLLILGAFQLYLDFVNLFIRILRIFGRRDRE